MAQNIFAQGMDAFDRSYDRTQNFFDKATDRQAGRALAGGDRKGAMQTYGNAGRVDAVRVLEGDQRQADTAEAAQRREAAQTLIAASDELAKIPDINERYSALSHPIFQMLIPQEQLSQIKPEHLTNEGLAMFRKQVQDELEIVKAADGSYSAVSKRTGLPAYQYSAPKDYKPDWRERTKADGSTEFFDINAESGGGAPAGPAAMPPQRAPQGRPAPRADDAVAELVQMGAKVTSGVRTPERNSAVGGNPNSYHLASRGGVARDLVPPQGMSMDQFHQVVRERLPPGWEAINERDHIHIEPGSYQVAQAGGQPQGRTIRGDAAQPKATGRMASAADKQRLGLPADGAYWIEPDGKPSPVGGEKPNKPLTEYQGKSVEYLNAALSGNDRLNDLARGSLYKPSTPTDSLFSREKDGTARLILRNENDRLFVQAAKEFLAPILRKDTGAAVTDSELATYMDIYIPKYEDSPRVMMNKAKARDAKLRALYGANRQAYDQTFGAPPKWQVLTDPRGTGQAPPARQKGKSDSNSVTVDGITMTVKPKTR